MNPETDPKIAKLEEMLKAYQETINKIDDFFEYSNESRKDRVFIYGQLDRLTEKLKRINKGMM